MCSAFFIQEDQGDNDEIGFEPNLLLLNGQSLNLDKINEINVTLNSLTSIDFICFTETWANENSITNMVFSNYNLCSFYCRSRMKGGGVAILCKTNIIVKNINLSQYCIDKDIEVCACSFKTFNKETIIIVCYRSGDLTTFFNNIIGVLDSVYKPNLNIILCGDFNLDSYNQNPQFDYFSTLLSGYNLKPIVKWPTRLGSSSLSTLDQIFINFIDEAPSYAIDNTISDHQSVFSKLNFANLITNTAYS